MGARSEAEDDLAGLHQRLRPALMSFFYRRLRNHADAEDLTQEVFIRLASSGSEIATPHAFVFRVAANLLRDRARHETVRFRRRDDLVALEERRVEWRDPVRVIVGRERLDVVEALLGSLPERTRRIFLLYRLEKMRRAEIAGIFGMSVSGVEKHIARAVAHLAMNLEDEA